VKNIIIIALVAVLSLGLLYYFHLLPSESEPFSANKVSKLPVFETARSSAFLQSMGETFEFMGFESCEEAIPVSALPDHVLYDRNGSTHTFRELIDIAYSLDCHYGDLIEDPEAAISVIQGGTATSADGITLDGSKQIFRVFAMNSASSLFARDLNPDVEANRDLIPSDEPESCDAIQDIVINGSTMELRFAAFDSLSNYRSAALLNFGEERCLNPRREPNDELEEYVKSGDIEAAITLSSNHFDDLLRELGRSSPNVPDPTREEAISAADTFAKLLMEAEYEKILAVADEYPLLAMSYAHGTLYIQLHTKFAEMLEIEPLYNAVFQFPGEED